MKVGDLVRLKSGGPTMTIADLGNTARAISGNLRPSDKRIFDVEWFAGDLLQRDGFEEASLVLVDGSDETERLRHLLDAAPEPTVRYPNEYVDWFVHKQARAIYLRKSA